MEETKNYTPIDIKKIQAVKEDMSAVDTHEHEEVMNEIKLGDIEEKGSADKPARENSPLLLIGIGILLIVQLFILYFIFIKKSSPFSAMFPRKDQNMVAAPKPQPTTAVTSPSPSPTLMPTVTPTLEQTPDVLETELNMLQKELETTPSGVETPPDIQVDF